MNTCDHGHQTNQVVKILPMPINGYSITLCHSHFLKEMGFRKEMIASGVQFDLPEWEDLKIYREED